MIKLLLFSYRLPKLKWGKSSAAIGIWQSVVRLVGHGRELSVEPGGVGDTDRSHQAVGSRRVRLVDRGELTVEASCVGGAYRSELTVETGGVGHGGNGCELTVETGGVGPADRSELTVETGGVGSAHRSGDAVRACRPADH